jgi:hypothetical protein
MFCFPAEFEIAARRSRQEEKYFKAGLFLSHIKPV